MDKVKLVLGPLLEGLGIKAKKVRHKAEEFMRLLDLRAKSLGGGLDTCKYAACVHLACRLHSEPFDREKALKIVGGSLSVYQQTYNSVSNVLGVSPTVSFAELAVKFGCPSVAGLADKMLSKYKERFLSALPAPQKKNADFKRLAFTAAAFFIAAEHMKVEIDKKKLIEVTDTTADDFQAVYSSMYELILEPLRTKQEAARQAEENSDATPGNTTVAPEHRPHKDDLDEDYDELEQRGRKRRKLAETSSDVALPTAGPKKDLSTPAPPPRSVINEVLDHSKLKIEEDVEFENQLIQEEGILQSSQTTTGSAPLAVGTLTEPQAATGKDKSAKDTATFEEWKNAFLQSAKVVVPTKAKQSTLSFVPKKDEKPDKKPE